MVVEILETHGEFSDDPVVERTMKELRTLLKANPKPEDMDASDWFRVHGETAKRIALKEVP